MKSIDFPKANVPLAKDQPEYQTLYIHIDKSGNDPQFKATCCLELTEEEVAEIVRTKRIFHTQLTFGRGYNPINMSTVSPFTQEESESETVPMDENRTPADEWDRTHYRDSHTHVVHDEEGPCINCGKAEANHFWSSRQCEL